MKQRQFLDVVDDARARELLAEAFGGLEPRSEEVDLDRALGRVLRRELRAAVDVPGFDRSNMDGFALRAASTFGAEETAPIRLRLRGETIAAGLASGEAAEIGPGEARAIATGGVLPRGADAVLMIEDSQPAGEGLIEATRALAPGTNVMGAGSDLGRGDLVLHAGRKLSSRDTALAAAVGQPRLEVFARPRALVFSTGDEIKAPGEALGLGEIHDSNGRVLVDALRECGAEARFGGILPDRREAVSRALRTALEDPEGPTFILLSGGTSKGQGDLNHEVVGELAREFSSRGLLFHGVALKPGKPLCVAEVAGRMIAVLPGFPTSAIFTFREFIAPIVRRLAGDREIEAELIPARLPMRLRSVKGRTEFVLVDLVPGAEGLAAYPLGAGSGSVSTFSLADGFIRVERHVEQLEEGEPVLVRPLGAGIEAADLVVIGSHCVGLELLLAELSKQGLRCKSIAVGSRAGLKALERGEGDLAGSHLLDAETGLYNEPFLPAGCAAVAGYRRRQGIVFRADDERFRGLDLEELRAFIRVEQPRMVNRNRGSGTRVLIDAFLGDVRPEGHHSEARSHHAVAAAVAQGRADWGITLDVLARDQGLGFVFLRDEHFDLIVPDDRRERPAVRALEGLFASGRAGRILDELGFASSRT